MGRVECDKGTDLPNRAREVLAIHMFGEPLLSLREGGTETDGD